jgi:acyl-CoA synthetase (AMP-forming)/AMP-acid ligase II
MRVLAQELVERAGNDPDGVAVIDGSGEHTYAEVVAEATALAEGLESFLSGAPTVLVQADNTWRTLAAAVGIGMRGGLVAVASHHATAGEFAMACDDLRPDAVFAAPETIDAWRVPDEPYTGRLVLSGGWELRSALGVAAGIDRWDGGSVVAMTSGSTGRPKCVVQSEDAIRYAATCTIDAVGLQSGDPVAALVPLSSVAAFCFGLYLPAMLGGPMVCLGAWRPGEALALMAKHRVRWTMLVPTMALQLSVEPDAEGALGTLAAMTVGGGPMDAGALGRAEQLLGTRILRVFGMSECLGHTTTRPSESAEVRLATDGRPFPGTELRVVDEGGHVLPAGATGLTQVRGPSFFIGYARDGAPASPELTADGFFPTGDVGRINADGTLNIVGRDKQIIIRGGRNIDINEVEAAIAQMPTVTQVCVVPVPDKLLGERAAALVVTDGTPLALPEVATFLAAADFPKFKWPEFVHVVATLPQNRVGKLSRQDAAAIAAQMATSGGR